MVLEGLARHGDSLRAFRAIPLQLRRLYTSAYQSYLFNRVLSAAIADGEDLCGAIRGDVCFDNTGRLSRHDGGRPAPPQSSDVLSGIGDAGSGNVIRTRTTSVAIPIMGYSYYSKTRFAPYMSSVLEEDECQITPKDFFIKEMQEVSGEGGFRDAIMQCSGYAWCSDSKTVAFSLVRGSFATMLLREIIKPPDPIAAGF